MNVPSAGVDGVCRFSRAKINNPILDLVRLGAARKTGTL